MNITSKYKHTHRSTISRATSTTRTGPSASTSCCPRSAGARAKRTTIVRGCERVWFLASPVEVAWQRPSRIGLFRMSCALRVRWFWRCQEEGSCQDEAGWPVPGCSRMSRARRTALGDTTIVQTMSFHFGLQCDIMAFLGGACGKKAAPHSSHRKQETALLGDVQHDLSNLPLGATARTYH